MTTPPDPRRLAVFARQTLLASAGVFGLTLLAGSFLRGHIESLATTILDTLGLWGVAAAVFTSDTTMLPPPPDIFIFGAATGEGDPLAVLLVVSAASVVAGPIAYYGGSRVLARIPWVSRQIEQVRPWGQPIFQRYGAWAVGIAALSPLPYSAFCWMAGTFHVPLLPFLLACTMRPLRFAAYLGMFRLGWFLT